MSSADKAVCESSSFIRCDGYMVRVTNVGSRPAGAVTITDTLPSGVEFVEVSERAAVNSPGHGFETMNETPFECTYAAPTVTCEYPGEAPPGDVLIFTVHVKVTTSAEEEVHNEVKVEEGGKLTAQASVANTLNPAVGAPFGVQDLSMTAYGVDGLLDTQAGDHPYGVTTSFDLNTMTNFVAAGPIGGVGVYQPVQALKDAAVYLPLGLVGNPLAAERCAESALGGEVGTSNCPAGSQIGTVALNTGGFERLSLPLMPGRGGTNLLSALYNMTPEGGHPAELGFNLGEKPVVMYANVVRTPEGWMLRVDSPSLPHERAGPDANWVVDGISLAVFGNPGEHNGAGSAAFFTNPAACSVSGPPKVRVQADSWEEPGRYVEGESTAYPQIEGCDMLQFNPTLELQPQSTQADTPSGYEVDLKVPQSPNVLGELATPDLKNATVALPQGVSLSPSAANGLEGCKATGPHGINIPTGLNEHGEPLKPDEVGGEGEEIGPDGLSRLAPGHCPSASQVGEVEIETPLLPKPLKGHVYVAQPSCGGAGQSPCTEADATNGNLYGIYLEVSGSGVIMKLKGKVSVDPQTGQLTTTFTENPQLPFEELKLRLDGGRSAALANPQTCGTYTTTSDLTPWSTPYTPDATPSSSFDVSSGPGGSACANTEAEEPNKPSFEAGTTTPLAGSYSPFVLKLSREDGSQRVKGLNATLPPGLLGKLAGVPYCPDAALAAAAAKSGTEEQASPSCPAASEVGTVNIGAGPGPSPFYTQGKAYLAGPYKGAPLSLAVITPAVAGPFDLGTVLVRNALYVDPATAQITAKSDPIPTILDGIPLDIRDIRLNLDKPEFTLNPTSCDPMAVNGEAISVLGQSASLSDRFQVGACNALGFKPKLGLRLFGKTNRGAHPRLRAVLTMPKGGANIARAAVTLPHSEFLDQGHIGTVCTRVQFAAGSTPGERCPTASIYGFAKAWSPLLDQPLQGPVYLRSSNHNLPDLVAALNGQIQIALDGRIDSVHGGIRNVFEVVPDAPVSKFILTMQGGKKGLLVNSTNLCASTNRATAKFDAQNGKIHDFNPVLRADCGKGGKHKRR